MPKWTRTSKQSDNLRKLAARLKSIQQHVFGMRAYVADSDSPDICNDDKSVEVLSQIPVKPEGSIEEVLHTCGTVCCAIGMTPFIFPKEVEEFVSLHPSRAEEYWNGWHGISEYLFGEIDSDYWAWMFESFWADVDDSPEGAAARIEYFASVKRPPKFYNRQKLRERSPEFVEKYQQWRDKHVVPTDEPLE